MKAKQQHGGARPGAGRKKIEPGRKKIPVSYKLPAWLVEWLRLQPESQASLIEKALVRQYRIVRPDAGGEG
jgi:hypothetical protein